MSLTREAVLDVLKRVADPLGGKDIVSAGMVRALNVDAGAVPDPTNDGDADGEERECGECDQSADDDAYDLHVASVDRSGGAS